MRTRVEAIPALLHIAVFLYFAGLVEFLWNIHRGIAYAMLCIVISLTGMYTVIVALTARLYLAFLGACSKL
jgi:hypothetical protein